MPKKPEPMIEPQTPTLRFSFVPAVIGPEGEAQIADYYRQCREFEAARDELLDRRDTLLEQAKDCTLGLLLEQGEQLSTELGDCQATFDSLIAARKALGIDLIPLAQAAMQQAQAAHEATLREVEQQLATQGVTVECLPGYGSNPNAAHRQWRHKLEHEDAALASRGKLLAAEQALRSCEACHGIPDGANEPIRWRGASGLAQQVAELIGVGVKSEYSPLRIEHRQFALHA